MTPVGTYHLKFANTGDHYTWSKVKTNVNNVIFGRMWLNHAGQADLENRRTHDICHLDFPAYSKQTSHQIPPNKINAIVKDSKGLAKYVIDGVCSEKINFADVQETKVVKSLEDYKHLVNGPWKLLWKRENQP